jgi:hypothetical protein
MFVAKVKEVDPLEVDRKEGEEEESNEDEDDEGQDKRKEFDCKRCSEKFSSRWQMKNHVIGDHNGMPYDCSVCDVTFRNRLHSRHSTSFMYEFNTAELTPRQLRIIIILSFSDMSVNGLLGTRDHTTFT